MVGVGTLAAFAGILGWANWPTAGLPPGAKVDRLVVSKSQRRLDLIRRGEVLASYPASLGRQPVGAKATEGDMRTPEGVYRISQHKEDSTCYRALRISYPSLEQQAAAKAAGRHPGGNIMIHGLKNGWGWLGRCHRWRDWTAGCVAVTNAEMDLLWEAVADGTPVELNP